MDTPITLNNRYRLERPLGRGGMATVYLAHDLMLERRVAVKVLRRSYSRDPRFRERFRQEAMAVARLSHPNIVTVHDFGLDQDLLFIVMEHVPGADLGSLLEEHAPLSIPAAIDLIVQACAGIGYAHRSGLVHCDVKPHNMLVTPDRRLKVTDFGIARALASIRADEQSRYIWGSPQYFSPEQAGGEPPSPASDVYSLGVVFYQMVTGRLPFNGATATELARMHRMEPPPPPSQYNPDIPPTIEQIILKVLSKEPARRYRTADQLGRVLLTFSRAQRAPAAQPRPSRPRPVSTVAPPTTATPVEEAEPIEVDWLNVFLGLLALLSVGGLIPFWMWVYFLYNPPR